jgi:hypothetical protein
MLLNSLLWSALWLAANGYVLAMVRHLKNVCPIFAQMPNRITNVEFTTVSPTIANTMFTTIKLRKMRNFTPLFNLSKLQTMLQVSKKLSGDSSLF